MDILRGLWPRSVLWAGRVVHPIPLVEAPSAVYRYVDEIRRLSGVLDRVLHDKGFLVGSTFSYADAVFVT